MDQLDPAIAPYVEAWRRFRAETRFVPDVALCERPIFDRLHLVGGTPDAPGAVAGDGVLVEKKSGVYAGFHEIQVAAYRQMLAQHYPQFATARMWLVYLSPTGYQLREVTDKHLGALFYAMTACVRGKERYAEKR